MIQETKFNAATNTAYGAVKREPSTPKINKASNTWNDVISYCQQTEPTFQLYSSRPRALAKKEALL